MVGRTQQQEFQHLVQSGKPCIYVGCSLKGILIKGEGTPAGYLESFGVSCQNQPTEDWSDKSSPQSLRGWAQERLLGQE